MSTSHLLHPDVMIDQLLWEHETILGCFHNAYEQYNAFKEDYEEFGDSTSCDDMLAAEDTMCDLLEALEHIEFMIEWFGGEVPVLEDADDDDEMDVCHCTQCKCQD